MPSSDARLTAASAVLTKWAWGAHEVPTVLRLKWGRFSVRAVALAYTAESVFLARPVEVPAVRGEPAARRLIVTESQTDIALVDSTGADLETERELRIAEFTRDVWGYLSWRPGADALF